MLNSEKSKIRSWDHFQGMILDLSFFILTFKNVGSGYTIC